MRASFPSVSSEEHSLSRVRVDLFGSEGRLQPWRDAAQREKTGPGGLLLSTWTNRLVQVFFV